MSPEARELSGGGSDSTCRPPPSSGWEQDHSCGGGTLEREGLEEWGVGGWGAVPHTGVPTGNVGMGCHQVSPLTGF